MLKFISFKIMNFQFNKIRTKLQLTFGIFLLLSAGMGGASLFYFQRISQHHQINALVDQLTILAIESRKNEKDFLLSDQQDLSFMKTGQSMNISLHEKNMEAMQHIIDQLSANPLIESMELQDKFDSISAAKRRYTQAFHTLTIKIREKGFKDAGLEGKMREVVHNLENNFSGKIDKSLLLTMRRHEKDFMIRKDEAYVTKLHQAADLMNQMYASDGQVKSAVNEYLTHFNRLVQLEKEIGLTEKSGLRQELLLAVAPIEPSLVQVRIVVNQSTKTIANASYWTVAGVIMVLMLLTAALGVYFSYVISRPLILLDRISRSIVNRLKNQDKFLDLIISEDEIGRLAQNLKLMLQKLKENISAVEAQNHRLTIAAEEEERKRWQTEGITEIGEVLHRTYASKEEQCYQILSQTVKYMGANQGSIFTLNDKQGTPYLELQACHAYNKKKFLQKHIALGQGLVGQAFLEGQYIYMTEVPQDYVAITSGLGEAKPGCILIMPLQVNKQIAGIIELAFFKPLHTHQLEFMHKISENIATTLISVELNLRTQTLLKDAQLMTEQMRAQEEEMRQNMEELSATQEAIFRKNEEMEAMLTEAQEREKMMRNTLDENIRLQEQMQVKDVQQIKEIEALKKAFQDKEDQMRELITEMQLNEQEMQRNEDKYREMIMESQLKKAQLREKENLIAKLEEKLKEQDHN